MHLGGSMALKRGLFTLKQTLKQLRKGSRSYDPSFPAQRAGSQALNRSAHHDAHHTHFVNVNYQVRERETDSFVSARG